MKKYHFLLIILFIFSCSPESADSPEEPPTGPGEKNNTAPSKPVLIYPTNELLCTLSSLMFEWDDSTDPDGDPVSYQLQIARNYDFSDIFYSGNSSSVTKEVELERGRIFYWRVSAKDNTGLTSEFSQVRSFYTEGTPASNTLPSLPELLFPQDGTNIESTTVTLKWSATDGNGDDLIYDLYFGESNSPELHKAALTTPDFTVSNLVKGKKYFWKVIVKDGRGGSAHGNIWSFNIK